MVELGIGAPGQAAKFGLVEAAFGERRQEARGQRRIVEVAAGAQLLGGEAGPSLGYEQAAVLGKPGQQHVLEAATAGLAASADVMDHPGARMAGRT